MFDAIAAVQLNGGPQSHFSPAQGKKKIKNCFLSGTNIAPPALNLLWETGSRRWIRSEVYALATAKEEEMLLKALEKCFVLGD